MSSSLLSSSVADGRAQDLTLLDCSRLLFEALGECSTDKLKLVICTHSVDDVSHSLLQRNDDGETPLVVAMKSKRSSLALQCVEELVDFLQRWHSPLLDDGEDQDSYDNNYTLFAKIIDELSNSVPILDVMDHLINDHCSVAWLDLVAHVFSSSTTLTRETKIIALELIGAYLIMDDTYLTYYRPFSVSAAKIGLQYWRRAMSFRLFPRDGEPPLPKRPHVAVATEASVAVFGSLVEVTTMQELDVLREEIQRGFYTLQHHDGQERPLTMLLHGHALLVARRIGKQHYADGPYALYLRYLMGFPPIHYDWYLCYGDFDEDNHLVLSICVLILQQVNGYDPRNISALSFKMLSRTLRLMSSVLISLVDTRPGTLGREHLSCANLLVPPQFFATILNYFEAPQCFSFKRWEGFENFGELVIRFLYVVDSISPHLTDVEKQQLEELYSTVIRCCFSERSTTVLQAAIEHGDEYDSEYDVTINLVTLVLKLGVDPNVIGPFGKTPLHYMAAQFHRLPEILPIFQAVVDSGGHLDMAAFDGETVIDILKRSVQFIKDNSHLGYSAPPYYASLLNTVFPLSCLCARVIREHGIPFDGGRLPLRLQEFVARHSAADVRIGDDVPLTYDHYMGH
ncbi:uncharacterized protein LOC124340729 [Daphnia pulicaria]|uniref:uncharacterized protein LOC124340729 n=1 Tax=Daphnia pulicaria TaxID=35523 RepID=UPI001EECC306|nr:uncharacterized protein LOC124340729 [Daphnia pulicaria]